MYIVLKRHSASLTLLFLLAASSVTAAYGHGLGADRSLPATISDKQVSVDASIKPTFIDQVSGSSPTFVVRALDDGTLNSTIPGVDFHIVVELQKETLLDQRFRSSDGVVAANLIPDGNIDGWEIDGQPAPDGQVQVSQSNPVELRSRILSAGGLYHIAVTIESSSPGIAVESDRKFDLYISIGRSYTYDVEGGMVVKTYYDEVTNFDYSNGTISFETPFTWDDAYVSQVPVLHMEVQFPKAVEELQTNSYVGTLNGRELEAQAIVIDDYTSEQNRIVHFVVNNAMLDRFAESADADVAAFALKPADKPKFPLDIMSLPSERFLFQLSWGPDLIETGVPVTFVMNLQDPATGDIVRGSSFDFVLTQGGTEIHRERMSSDFGTYAYDYTFANAGTAMLSASNINGQGESAKIDLVVLQGTGDPVPPPVQQPSGCLIATAAFGSELTPQVQYLRHFRDNYILSTASGSAFMNSFNSVYYSFSPQVADYEREQPWLQATVKTALYPLFGILTAAERTHAAVGGEAGAIMAGATASALIGAAYLAPAGYVASRKVSSRLLVIILGAAAAILAITLVALPALLPISTAAFVIAAAGSSAILVAMLVRKMFKQFRKP
ncbi:MAG TPA: CFI-box-CTERM domain-containing protein [Nitrososphaera sp.]|nr:CFI-box-CTERM domain-containing protein [Nitrososphaera sp.]